MKPKYIGIGFIILGAMIFLRQFIDMKFLFPAALIGIGIAIVAKGGNQVS